MTGKIRRVGLGQWRFPNVKPQAFYSGEFACVMSDPSQVIRHGNGSDHEIIRTNQSAVSSQHSTNTSIDFSNGIIERQACELSLYGFQQCEILFSMQAAIRGIL
jgi:hypothetical protein